MNGAAFALSVAAVLTGVGDVRSLTATDDVHWVGTTGGLVRIEGSEIRVMTPREGLPDGTVRAVLGSGNRVFVGTDRGIAVVTADSGEVVETFGRGHRVTALRWHDGSLYVGTDRGVFAWRDRSFEQVEATGPVRALASMPDGLYVGTANRGTRRFASTSGEEGPVIGRSRRLRGHRLVWDMVTLGDALWVVTPEGVEKFVGGRRRAAREVRAARSLVPGGLRSIAAEDGRLVLGGVGGAWQFEGGRFRRVLDAGDRVVQAIHTSRSIAIGTDRGLALLDNPDADWLLEGGLPSNDLTGLATTSEGLWVGTFRHGLTLFREDGSTEHFDERHGLVDPRINRLATVGDDLWIATDRGVSRRTRGQFELVGLLDRHVSFVAAVDSTVYAGAGDLLYVYLPGGFEVVAQPGVRLQDVASHEHLVVASAEGLAVQSERGFDLLTSDDRLPDDWVTAAEYVGGALYVGTYNAGVARVESGVSTTVLPGTWVNPGAMHTVGDALAVGTLDEGLVFVGESEQTRLTTAQGLPDNDVTSVLADRNGQLWVATRGGLAYVAVEPVGGSTTSGRKTAE